MGTITHFLNLGASINKGVPFSVRRIAFGIGNEFIGYRGLTCCLQHGDIRIYCNYSGTLEYSINIGKLEREADPTRERVNDESDNDESEISIHDFKHHILTVTLSSIQSLVSIKLEGNDSWRIIYVRTGYSHPWSVISSKSIVSWTTSVTGLRFDWFDLDEGTSKTLDIDRGISGLQVVASGPNVYIGSDREDEVGYQIGQLKLTDQGLIYEHEKEFLHMTLIYPDGKGGVKLLNFNSSHGITLFKPFEDEPVFCELSYNYFQLDPNGLLNNIAHLSLTKITPARVADGAGIVFATKSSKGRSLFFANFDARCEHWTCLKDRPDGFFHVAGNRYV